MSISVVFVIKNAFMNGYCFWESLQSCLPFADEIIISEGYSEDNTWKTLLSFKNKYGDKLPIMIYRDKWPIRSYHGEAIRIVSERAISKATKKYVFYLQADEIIHEDSVEFIRKACISNEYSSITFPFYHFIRSLRPSNEGYKEAIRMVKNGQDIKLKGDAWTFEPVNPVSPSNLCPKPTYHFAWIFPKNNDIKDIEHAKIYTNFPDYQDKMRKAISELKQEKKPYVLEKDFDDFPKLSRRFLGQIEYKLP